MFICAGKSEQFDFAVPVGIGLIEVTMNLTKLCLSQKPEFLFFVGSAGSYGEKKIFDIVESKTACNIENSFFNAGAYTPLDNMISTAEDVSRETIINSSNYITTDESVAKHYLSKNIHLENMEYFAVLKVAEAFSIPVAGVFIVTNYCNVNAHKDFLKNHKEAMKRLSIYIKRN
ncbi:Purine nucleoside phosphorylase [hydrothermal vent metagenome]|uniref:Purine nucleoside phosphorylase n=1 Tax=hydrothermal vent metagenome TaxID=652676 RepID=A0A1W1BV74_9ZZZZ